MAVACNGLDGLRIVSEVEPDLVLLDALMPDLDGFETCKLLKANPETADIPIIFMTSLNELHYRVRGFSVGAIDYVIKPVENTELLARVKTQISLRKATRALQKKNAELEKEIKERAAAEQALIGTLRQLEHRTEELHLAQAHLLTLEKDAAEIRMAGGFAHEMRNVLTGAKVLLDQVDAGSPGDGNRSLCLENSLRLKDLYIQVKDHVPPEVRAAVAATLRDINSNEQAIEAIVRDVDTALARGLASTQAILEYAQLGQARPGIAPVPMRPLVECVLKESASDLAAHDISVHVTLPPDCVLRGKDIHFYSILKNLVLNARDALVEQEKLDELGSRSITISLTEEPNASVLCVADTGPGIPPKDHERIFEPFFTTKPNHGTGLGLGVVRKLVSLYKGTLDVESEPSRGATFRISFPHLALRSLPPAASSERSSKPS